MSTDRTRRNSPTKAGRRSYHHGAVREMLLVEALALVEEGGVAVVSLREAARRIGISHSAAYHHFGDKQELIIAAATEGMRLLAAALQSAEAEPAADAAERVCRISSRYVEFAMNSPHTFRLIFAPEVAQKARYPELRAASDEAAAPLLRALAAWWGEGPYGREDMRELAVSLWSLAHGFAELALNAQFDEGELHVPMPRRAASYGEVAWRAAARHLQGLAADRIQSRRR